MASLFLTMRSGFRLILSPNRACITRNFTSSPVYYCSRIVKSFKGVGMSPDPKSKASLNDPAPDTAEFVIGQQTTDIDPKRVEEIYEEGIKYLRRESTKYTDEFHQPITYMLMFFLFGIMLTVLPVMRHYAATNHILREWARREAEVIVEEHEKKGLYPLSPIDINYLHPSRVILPPLDSEKQTEQEEED